VAQDITSRKEAERTLRESEERFRKIFDAGPAGVAIVDPEGRILRANSALCRMLGYEEAELLDRFAPDFSHPEERDSTIQMVRALAAGDVSLSRREKRYVTKKGETVWADVAASVVRDDRGQALYGVAVLRDISQQKKAEEQLRASEERMRQLAAYVVEAREQERTRISRELHDELGQTLSSLRMRLEDLAADCDRSNACHAEIGRAIARVAEHLQSSIESVKRICAQLRPGVLDHFGLGAAIEWQAREFETSTGIQCVIREMPEKLAITAEQSTAVFRVLQEILTNVARHSGTTRACVRLRSGAKWLTLSVRDNGAGIRKAQVNDPRSLGVLGMQERARLLGGSIEFKGVRGKGTTVTLRLPKSMPPSAVS
jgi:PAS domain S-box-containing protein